MKRIYEFHAYPGDSTGAVASEAQVTQESHCSEASARGAAGRLSKRINGPVDLAVVGRSSWHNRYMTTAAPSEHHASGYRFERLDG